MSSRLHASPRTSGERATHARYGAGTGTWTVEGTLPRLTTLEVHLLLSTPCAYPCESQPLSEVAGSRSDTHRSGFHINPAMPGPGVVRGLMAVVTERVQTPVL